MQDIGEEEDARLGVGEEVYRKHDGVFFQLRSDQRRRDVRSAGEVLRFESTEFTPSPVTPYRPMEYVRVACAYECRIHTTMCLPVFLSEEAMKNERPFTILEVALCHMTESIGELYAATAHEFMKLGLFTTGHDRVGPERYMRKFIESTVETLAPGHANALGLMCETLNVPFAQFWIESNGLIVTAGCPYFGEGKRVSELPGHVVANIADGWPRTGWTGALERDLNLGGRRSKSIPDRVAVASHVYFTRFERFVRV